MRDQLKQGVPLDELLTAYGAHREKYKQEHQFKMKGWDEIKYDYHQGYKPNNEFHMKETYSEEYNIHNTDSVSGTPYWSSKEEDSYWKLSKWERLKLIVKEKVSLRYYKELFFLNLLTVLLLIYYAKKKSKQIII